MPIVVIRRVVGQATEEFAQPHMRLRQLVLLLRIFCETRAIIQQPNDLNQIDETVAGANLVNHSELSVPVILTFAGRHGFKR